MTISRTFRDETEADSSATSITSSSFDSTGAKSVVVWAKHEGAPTTVTFSDSKGNTYTALTKIDHTNGDLSARIGYVLAASVGTGHTVTATFGASKAFRRLAVWTIGADNATALDVSAQAQGTGTTPDAGSLVTTAASVSFLGIAEYNVVSGTPSSGWTEDFDVMSKGYSRADATAQTIDPSCTVSVSMDWIASGASFKEAAAAADFIPYTLTPHIGPILAQ